MFGYVERNADCLSVFISKSYFDIHFTPFHIFSEHPHFAALVELVNKRAFGIVFDFEVAYHQFVLQRCYFEFFECVGVFVSVVPKQDAEYLDLCIELIQKLFDVLFCYNCLEI